MDRVNPMHLRPNWTPSNCVVCVWCVVGVGVCGGGGGGGGGLGGWGGGGGVVVVVVVVGGGVHK